MIKNNKWKLVLSSVVILLPMLVGFFGSSILPEEIIIHWGIDGTPDGWGSPLLVFVALPLILLVVHWLCIILTAVIEKNVEQNRTLMNIMFWIIPAISLTTCGMIFSIILGYTPNVSAVLHLLFAILFILIGNYMPKTTRNRTMGIKIKWTLANDENWNATHRFSGKVYVIVGFLCLLSMPIPMSIAPYLWIVFILLVSLLPTVYSYRFYKRQLAEGKATKEDYEKGYLDIVKNKSFVYIIVALILVVAAVLMFVGKVETTADDTGINVKATFWSDLYLEYEDIDSVEYRENGVDGERINGYASARLLLGIFRNDEFGLYTRYTYTGDKPCVVLTIDDDIVVLGAEDEETLKAIYDSLSEKIS